MSKLNILAWVIIAIVTTILLGFLVIAFINAPFGMGVIVFGTIGVFAFCWAINQVISGE